jgi:hypothetical protein
LGAGSRRSANPDKHLPLFIRRQSFRRDKLIFESLKVLIVELETNLQRSIGDSFFPLKKSNDLNQNFIECHTVSNFREVISDLALHAIDTPPTDKIFSSRRRFPLKIHNATRADHHINPGTDWTAGHTGGFMNRDLFPEVFLDNELTHRVEKRWTIVGAGFDLIRAEFQCGFLGRTLAFRTDVDIKPEHGRPLDLLVKRSPG